MSTGFVKKDLFGGAMTGNIPVGYLDVRFVSFFLSFLSDYIALGISSLIKIGGFSIRQSCAPPKHHSMGENLVPFSLFREKSKELMIFD